MKKIAVQETFLIINSVENSCAS